MSIDIDAAAVLKAVIAAPEVFKDIDADLAKFAHGVVLKQLKAKGANASRLHDIYRVIGKDAFLLVIEAVPDDGKALKSLLAKFDKHWPELDAAAAPALRKHVADLAAGAVDPAGKPGGAAKDKKPKAPSEAKGRKKPAARRAISFTAFTAAWDGKDRTE